MVNKRWCLYIFSNGAVSFSKMTNTWEGRLRLPILWLLLLLDGADGFIILSDTGQNRISAKESMVSPYYYTPSDAMA